MTILDIIRGGDKRSLKGVDETVQLVLANPEKLSELYNCLFYDDEIVKMRASDALEKICRQRPDLLEPYLDKLIDDVAQVKQPSIQWHLAQIFSEVKLSSRQKESAIKIMRDNLDKMDDWIVVNLTLESLANFVRKGDISETEFGMILEKFQRSRHKSVVSRVGKLKKEFGLT